MSDVLYQSIIAFVSQVGFIWARTYNVHTTANLELAKTMWSGAIIHILWLVGISIGANGVYKVMVEYNWSYIPVIVWSLMGSLIGCYGGMKARIRDVEQKADREMEDYLFKPPTKSYPVFEMTKERRKELELDNEVLLTDEELSSGYHFCLDWDQMLIGPFDREWSACNCNWNGYKFINKDKDE